MSTRLVVHHLVAWILLAGLSSCAVNPVPTPGAPASLGGGGATGEFAGGDAKGADRTAKSPDATAGSDTSAAADTAVASFDMTTGAEDASASETLASDPDAATAGNTGLTQAGAQDFGLFRQLLESGKIPSPNALDDLGFFAEHKLDYPDPKCGQDMCMHALLGIMGNMITGSTCTLVQIGLNTPIQVDKLKRPPLDMVIALDVSGSMQGQPMQYVQQGLQQMLDHLQKDDLVSLVTFADGPTLVLQSKGLTDKAAIEKAILQLQAKGQTDLFGGLFQALQVASKMQKPGRQTRVVLLSDGSATVGLTNPAKLVSLATAYAKQGIGITTIGVGKGFEIPVLRDLAEVGAGNFYFLDKLAAVKEVFTEEVETFLVPVALDVQIDVQVADGYLLGGVYGTHGWKGGSAGGKISIASLFVAGRTAATDPLPGMGEGRRGGGGAILLELVGVPGIQQKGVTKLALSWTHPLTKVVHKQAVQVDGPIAPGAQIPDGGVFSHPTVEKGFVMLNLYAGFQLACQLALDGDTGAARGVLEALQGEVGKWLNKYAPKSDPDIVDDNKYVSLFIANLKQAANQTPISKPPEPWPKD